VGLLSLVVWMLLCMIRDAGADAGAKNATTATSLGRTGASWIVILAIALMAIASGVLIASGVYGWPAGAVLTIAGLIVVWCVATRSEENVIPVWAGVSLFLALVAASDLPTVAHEGVGLTPDSVSEVDRDRDDDATQD